MLEKPITVSCLTTKPDYADFKSAAAKAMVNKNEIRFLRITGCVLILAAFLLRAFFSGGFFQYAACTAMAAVGVIVGAFYDSIMRYAVRAHALREYEDIKKKFFAQITEFGESTVEIKTDRYTASIPYELFYKVYEDARMFILYTGINEMKFIPKRAMNEQECKQIQDILRSKLKEKYQQEGAR